jgi:hypothetical protein
MTVPHEVQTPATGMKPETQRLQIVGPEHCKQFVIVVQLMQV